MKMGFQAVITHKGLLKNKLGGNSWEIEWSRLKVHPPQQVLEARVVAEEKNEGSKINFVRLASGSSYEYARL